MRLLLLLTVTICLFNGCSSKNKEQKPDSVALPTNTTGTTPLAKEDWECIAGEKAGVITAITSEQELIGKLGSANVSAHDTVFGAEGFFSIGTILFKGTPNEAQIVWKDTTHFRNPEYVELGFAPTGQEGQIKWFTNTGIKVGTTLKELEQINVGSFRFSGFGWDYGGTVVDWAGGKLADPHSPGLLSVILAYEFENPALQTVADKLLGDSAFDSTDPNAQKLNPYVSHFIISFR
ncbi:hypothetical protein [Emticicia sp. TH156]|uniref:hypothetical protein n=1 Tax=Emticicia sp. TH156 TaxID=2067454 RepID=UPI000C769944|nr:hypothetical protein [Emticicia sp. TH156]PLK43113.1 hypothetical protein C0V77_17185 [Emticicia sp. TH156]